MCEMYTSTGDTSHGSYSQTAYKNIYSALARAYN